MTPELAYYFTAQPQVITWALLSRLSTFPNEKDWKETCGVDSLDCSPFGEINRNENFPFIFYIQAVFLSLPVPSHPYLFPRTF